MGSNRRKQVVEEEGEEIQQLTPPSSPLYHARSVPPACYRRPTGSRVAPSLLLRNDPHFGHSKSRSPDRGHDLWQNFESHLERLATHLPEVLLACLVALAVSFAREASKLRRSKKKPGCLDFFLGCFISGVLGGGGGLIGAAAATLPFKEVPWVIVAIGASIGIAVDLTSAAGARFLLAMVIRTTSRFANVLAAQIEPPGERLRRSVRQQESDSSSSSDSDGS